VTKNEFLSGLSGRLKGIPEAERLDAMRFYEEYFADAGPEKEQEILTELGSPAGVAAQIIANYAAPADGKPAARKDGWKTFWIVLLAVFASPVALPVAIVLFVVAIVIMAVVLSLVVGAAAVVLVCAGVGIIALFSSFAFLIADFPTFLFMLGCALLLLGVCILFFKLAQFILRYGTAGVNRMLGRSIQKKGGKVSS